LIVEINEDPINDVSELQGKLGKNQQGQVTIIREGRSRIGAIYL
jgi:hypothetical protein